MSFEMAFVFAVLVAFFLFVTERYPIDQVALAISRWSILLGGVLNAEEALRLRGCWTPQRAAPGGWPAARGTLRRTGHAE